MFKCSSREDPRTAIRIWKAEAGVLCVAVESPLEAQKVPLSALLASFDNQLTLSERGLDELASRIDVALKAQSMPGLPAWVTFVAAWVTARDVAVCSAGAFRVLLAQGPNVTVLKREHTLLTDLPPPDWNAEALSVVNPELHGSLVTRGLGNLASRGPELATCKHRAPSRIVIASPDLYQGGLAAKYVELGAMDVASEGPAVIVIDVRSD